MIKAYKKKLLGWSTEAFQQLSASVELWEELKSLLYIFFFYFLFIFLQDLVLFLLEPE